MTTAAGPLEAHSTMSSNESRQDIARRMLLSAPPGQLERLVEDFNTLFQAAGETALDDNFVQLIKSQHASNQSDSPVDLQLQELYDKVKAYQDEYYSSNGVVSALAVTQQAFDTAIRTYAERVDNANFQACSWTGEWTLSSTNDLQGTVTVRAFCFEDATVQQCVSRSFGPTHVMSKSVATQIQDWEQEVTDSLNETYGSIGTKLKSLRRVMPVTRTKMDWNVLSHRMVKLLDSSKQQAS